MEWTGYFVMVGGIAAFVWIVILLDYLGRRKNAQPRH